jgi:3-oxoacyl-[acyl-carrier-protein] synthase II
MGIKRRVVITGLGVVAPNGIGKRPFWQSLLNGRSAVGRVTAFDASEYPCRIAAQVKDFRISEFVSGRHRRPLARFSQFAVAASRLAIEDAGLMAASRLPNNTLVCFGSGGGGDVFENAMSEMQKGGVRAVNPWAALDYPPHAPSCHVSIEFRTLGRALSVSSNCCTGLDAIYTATQELAYGRADCALAGSAEAPITPAAFATFCALGALTKRNDEPAKASRPYDLLRDGLVVGEGGAAFVLEPLDTALERGARPYAEVKGYGAVSEAVGMRKGDLTGATMASALQLAIFDAGLGPEDIDHINAHGSSLPDFDICDTSAFKQALGDHAYRVPVSSIKSMIGQPFSAAGGLQVAAACLALEDQRVPPTINQEFPDRRCDLDYVANQARVCRLRNVLVNAHAFGGGCAALVVGKI